jgi:molecular chaperone HscB
MTSCWNCDLDSFDEDFCQHCGKIQPLLEDTDYFEFLGFKELLDINRDKLETKFYELSKKFHPDYYSNGSDVEKEFSLDKSSYLNKAYKTLKDPFSRAKYLLKQLWGEKTEQQKNIPQELLMEVMELHEMIDSLKQETDPGKKHELETEVNRIRDELVSRSSGLEGELAAVFGTWDNVADNLNGNKLLCSEHHKLLKEMNDILVVKSYLDTLIRSIEEEISEGIS